MTLHLAFFTFLICAGFILFDNEVNRKNRAAASVTYIIVMLIGLVGLCISFVNFGLLYRV